MTVGSKGMRVLIVEDESPLRLLLTEFLCDEGFDITEAESGDQAIRLLSEYNRFDLLFTDICMPGKADGNAVGARARQLNPEIAILYASASPENLENKIGPCDAFLVKPCKLADIINMVEHLLFQSATRGSAV
jgi:CheY-like chemotaxis protein